MSPIKELKIVYEFLNEDGSFSEGDPIAGTVSFTLTEDTEVKGLLVKAKGEARVHWSEGTGERRRSYHASRRYFKVKEYLIPETGTQLPKGVHRFKFRLQIPQGNMPSSFKGIHGNIHYLLVAKMSRSWRWPAKVQQELKFVSKSISYPGKVMCPQSGSVEKELGVFHKGKVQMSATLNTKFCSPGDTLSAVAKISNNSTKNMKPKFSIEQRIAYHAQARSKHSVESLWKSVGETITGNSEENVSCQVQVPANIIYTVQNCDIISVEHYLKVYLDISFAFDPEVVFPLVIVPPGFAALQPGEAMGPYPAGAAGAPSYSDFPPPAFPVGPYPAPAGSGAYGNPALYPTLPANMTSGYNNPWPQQAAPYGFPTAASSTAQHQTPTAPPLFQQADAPPSYASIFPPAQDTFSTTGSDKKS
ncbi:arrestin domain-containing protein 3-like [Plectropomus leopardus]|nr:arrestin domain-containing protein 3-like [Plectropomus leopardus]XP_042342508.1 arrestin domain-containing protein 3-like [Plectropomus leopardus]